MYQDKDYEAEADYLHRLLTQFGDNVQNVLEFGCGTGRHAELLTGHGYRVCGIEMSETMQAQAQVRAQRVFSTTGDELLKIFCGDMREFHVPASFDAVISVFHVVSYQVTNEDISRTFANAARHLRPGGIFVFDVWYGPAVWSTRPAVRVKRMENESVQVTRIAEPVWDVNQNRVDVNFTVFVRDQATGQTEQLNEVHPMRYFFIPELSQLAERHDFELIHGEEWLTSVTPSENTWGVCFVLRRVKP